jgi:sulfite oxidase
MHTHLSRRRFLALAAGATASVALGGLFPRRVLAAASAIPDGMIVRNDRPEHWETQVEALGRAPLTANERFFVRSHFPVPEVDTATGTLEIAGACARPRRYTLAELQRGESATRTVTLECAGNGRARMALANTSGTQWDLGAVGTAQWTGASLGDLLREASPSAEAAHVWFECADQAPMPDVPLFVRSIPLAKALDDVMLAWGMNGKPLPRLHGAPLRAVVPGWFGMASAKWVRRIRLEPKPSDNHFMIRGYRYNAPGEDPAKAAPVEAMRVKSLITAPLAGSTVKAGALTVRGFAWGDAPIAQVDLSMDGGRTWSTAVLTGLEQKGAWRTFEAALPLDAGAHTLLARATDAAGQAQPRQARINAGGYGNNSWHEVAFHAR